MMHHFEAKQVNVEVALCLDPDFRGDQNFPSLRHKHFAWFSTTAVILFSASMTATLGDPFLLTTYPISKRKKTDINHNTAHLYASPVASSSSSSSGLVSIAVQGDGLHILDVGYSRLWRKK
jgi:hypothetical protein